MRKHVCQDTFYQRRNQGIQPDVHQVAPLPLHFSLWTYFKLLPGIFAHEVWNPQVFLLDFPTAWFLSEISLELLERHMTVVGLEICSTSYSMKVWSRRWRLKMLSEQKRHKSDFIHIFWSRSNSIYMERNQFLAPFQGPCSPKRAPPHSLNTTALPTPAWCGWRDKWGKSFLFLSTSTQTQVESEEGLAGGEREDKRVISAQMSLGNLLLFHLLS